MSADQSFGLGTAVGFDHADDDIDTVTPPRRALRQHLVGLADAGCGTEEDLEAASALLRGCAQEGVGIGAARFCS